jgi:two-component system sensor histidine kinase/response regulator
MTDETVRARTPPPRLLVTEDNLGNQLLVRALARAHGYDVTVAGNGRQAVDAHMIRPYDLILMDCHMPVMDGFEATRKIREHERELKLRRVPIIALTIDTEARDACLGADMDDFLCKPCDKVKIGEVLRRWLSAAAEHRDARR